MPAGFVWRGGHILGFKGLSRFLVIGERKIFGEIGAIVKIANDANEIMMRMLKEFNLETLTVENRDMSALEKQADVVAFGVRRDITDGAVNPTVLDNLLTCVDIADSMVDDYHYLARELTRMARVELDESRNRMPSLDSAVLSMLSLGTPSFAKVRALLDEKDMDAVTRERQEIERLEEQGDEIKDNAFDELYRLAPRMDYLTFIHYSEVLHKVDDILDACEDMSDMVVSIIASISK
jgi:uncharacterized protein Yka (UPF0111/DUF47 family)